MHVSFCLPLFLATDKPVSLSAPEDQPSDGAIAEGTLGPGDIMKQAWVSSCPGAVMPLELEIPSNRCPHPSSQFKVESSAALQPKPF